MSSTSLPSMDADARSTPQGRAGATPDDSGVTLLDFLVWLGERKAKVVSLTLVSAALSVAVALFLPNTYTARASLLPPAQSQGSGASAALAALGAMGGSVGNAGARTNDELYIALLRSDSVLRALDKRFDLRARVEAKTFEELRSTLPRFVRLSSDRRSGVISIDAEFEDPKFAAELANAFGEELSNLLSRLAVSEAQQRRIFFEGQLQQTKANLTRAEAELRRRQESSGVVVLDRQAEAILQGAATVRAQIAEREVQLQVLRSSTTSQNPDVLRLQAELRALRNEMNKLVSGTRTEGGSSGLDNFDLSKLPEAALEFIRARRELKLQETLLEGLIRQLETARLDEAKEGPNLQVVDIAIPPERKSGPKRGFIILATLLGAALLSSLAAMGAGYLRRSARADRDTDRALDDVRRAWRWKVHGA